MTITKASWHHLQITHSHQLLPRWEQRSLMSVLISKTPPIKFRVPHHSSAPISALYSSTRNVLTFVNTTAIAYRQNSAFLPGSWHHAIVVVFTNVRTLRVSVYLYSAHETFSPGRHGNVRFLPFIGREREVCVSYPYPRDRVYQ